MKLLRAKPNLTLSQIEVLVLDKTIVSSEHRAIARVVGTMDSLWLGLGEFKSNLGNACLDSFAIQYRLLGASTSFELPFTQFYSATLRQGLEHSVEQGQLKCFYQPIVRSNQTVSNFGFELLVRFEDPAGYFLSAKQFFDLPVNTDTKNIVLHAAFVACLRGLAGFDPHQRAFVNTDPRLFTAGIINWESALDEICQAGFNRQNLVFEIIESAEQYDISDLKQFTSECHSHGIRVAVDDLGSQNRGLEVLNAVRPDFVKLEMELVRDCYKDPYRNMLVQGTIDTCRKLGAIVIVEGIEQQADHEWMLSTNAQLAQGYCYGRPTQRPTMNERVDAKKTAAHPPILRVPHLKSGFSATQQTMQNL